MYFIVVFPRNDPSSDVYIILAHSDEEIENSWLKVVQIIQRYRPSFKGNSYGYVSGKCYDDVNYPWMWYVRCTSEDVQESFAIRQLPTYWAINELLVHPDIIFINTKGDRITEINKLCTN